jgi:hypothetical protein
MTELNTPAYLQDAKQLLTDEGFTTSNVWYHGTSSGLITSITNQGLVGGGDAALMKRMQSTLKTIQAPAFTAEDPVFLTQSKELAYYWAEQKAKSRNLYFSNGETAVVFAVTLSDDDNAKVKTDAGGAALLMEPGNAYLTHLKEVYKACGKELEEINPLKADRMDYLNKLGLAYCAEPISKKAVTLLQGE